MIVKVDSSFIVQLEEKVSLLGTENSLMKQQILAKDREIARLQQNIGKLYQQVHGRPMPEGLFYK